MIGSVCALDVSDASNTEDSNLTNDNVNALSQEKLEVSSENSISETNIVNSHDDNLDDYPEDSVKSNNESYYEGNGEQKLGLADNGNVITSCNDDYLLSSYACNDVVTADNSVVKDKTTIKGKQKAYIPPSKRYTYTVTLTSEKGGPVKDCKVYFSYNGNTATAITDANGKASIVISIAKKGTYNITYRFKGTKGLNASNSSGILIIKSPESVFTASDLKMNYKDGSVFSVKFTDKNGNPLSGKTIKFKLNNVMYSSNTNSKGIATLAIGKLKPGNYIINYAFSTLGKSDYNLGHNNLVINKALAKISSKNLVMGYGDGSSFKVTLKTNSGDVLKNVSVKFKINGKMYVVRSNSKGIAKLKIKLPMGYYTIKSAISNICYQGSVTNNILVNGTKFIANDVYYTTADKIRFTVKLIDGKNKVIKNTHVKFKIDGKTFTRNVNSNGIAKVNLYKFYNLKHGDHKITYSHGTFSGTSTIHVVGKMSINQIIDASKDVKSYIEQNSKLPSSVKIGNIEYSTADYLYLALKATVNLNSGKDTDIIYKHFKNPSKPGSSANKGNLYDYVSVARSVINTAYSTGKMPNSVDSDVGEIGYKGLVYAFARIVAFYGDEDIMPAYVTIKTLSSDSSSSSSLNSKNTISDLAEYLAASTNCQVDNSKIKQLVNKLTKGLTSDTAKAEAIYNYVRDTISYSFYYDTRYGAVGTLDAKTGNCVDHSHLLVAMYRAAGLPARYAHGTCTFSSGTYGHVWTQVLIGDTWIVSDATSARNSFGKVVNWNADSYSLKGYYASIGF